VKDVMDMLEEYKRLAKVFSKLKLKIPNNGKMTDKTENQAVQQVIKALPPQMLKQMGGITGLQTLMKKMGGKDMTQMLGGMGLGGDLF
jgi:signal recognition particle subunit SRP54